jgi:hypothetical protein
VNCRNQGYSGIHHDGGYAEVMIAKASGLMSIPDTLSSVDAAPLLCAGLTTFSALPIICRPPLQTGSLRPDKPPEGQLGRGNGGPVNEDHDAAPRATSFWVSLLEEASRQLFRWMSLFLGEPHVRSINTFVEAPQYTAERAMVIRKFGQPVIDVRLAPDSGVDATAGRSRWHYSLAVAPSLRVAWFRFMSIRFSQGIPLEGLL